jgi:hypothetical protein
MGSLSQCQTQIGAHTEPGLTSGILCGRSRVFDVLLTSEYPAMNLTSYRSISNEQ